MELNEFFVVLQDDPDEKIRSKIGGRLKSKRASINAGPLLTNPLNSCTKLQISAT
jgi:hypothetical protein